MNRKLTLVLFVLVTITFGTIYVATQQLLRMSANDPQIQMAQDAATELNTGVKPSNVSFGYVNIDSSLATFINVYNKNGNAVAGNGFTSSGLATPPIGVIKDAGGKTYSAITWEPKSGVRQAVVSVASNDYYVVSGRSLTEIEKRENNMLGFAAIGWLASCIVILAASDLSPIKSANTKKK
jgi:hypothetical protein